MTRLEVIKLLRKGESLTKTFWPEGDNITRPFEVMLRIEEFCNFRRSRQPDHIKYGPIHLRFWAIADPHWIHITSKQLLGFIRRNYER